MFIQCCFKGIEMLVNERLWETVFDKIWFLFHVLLLVLEMEIVGELLNKREEVYRNILWICMLI